MSNITPNASSFDSPPNIIFRSIGCEIQSSSTKTKEKIEKSKESLEKIEKKNPSRFFSALFYLVLLFNANVRKLPRSKNFLNAFNSEYRIKKMEKESQLSDELYNCRKNMLEFGSTSASTTGSLNVEEIEKFIQGVEWSRNGRKENGEDPTNFTRTFQAKIEQTDIDEFRAAFADQFEELNTLFKAYRHAIAACEGQLKLAWEGPDKDSSIGAAYQAFVGKISEMMDSKPELVGKFLNREIKKVSEILH